MKYNGHELPEWAKWVARDEDWHVYAYSRKPIMMSGFWDSRTSLDNVEYITTEYNSSVDWRDSLVELKEEKPMIELNKTYKDGLGRDVRIICVDAKNGEYTIIGLVTFEKGEEFVVSYTKDGMYAYVKSEADLILTEDFRTFAIDEPVMVRDDDDDGWERGNFAGVSDSGKPMTWYKGTKWASNGNANIWLQCRRPTKKELES